VTRVLEDRSELTPVRRQALVALAMQRDRDYRVNGWARKAVGQIRTGG
jgi:hypothetical protein